MLSNPTESTFRNHRRNRTLKPASIVFNNGNTVLNCTMRNYSATGAQLELSECAHTSKHVELLLKNEKKTVYCDVIWRKGNLVGVTFLSSWKSINPKIKSRSLSKIVIDNIKSQSCA